MKIRTLCSFCQAKLSVGSKYAGQTIECPRCHHRIAVPPIAQSSDGLTPSDAAPQQETQLADATGDVREPVPSRRADTSPMEESPADDWGELSSFADEHESPQPIHETRYDEDEFEELPELLPRRKAKDQRKSNAKLPEVDPVTATPTYSSWMRPAIVGVLGVGFLAAYQLASMPLNGPMAKPVVANQPVETTLPPNTDLPNDVNAVTTATANEEHLTAPASPPINPPKEQIETEVPDEQPPGRVSDSVNSTSPPSAVSAVETIPLEDVVSDAFWASGGMKLLLYLKKASKLAVYDVISRRIVTQIPIKSEGALIAAGQDKFVVVSPSDSMIERWSLQTLKLETKKKWSGQGTINSIAMGWASDGPPLIQATAEHGQGPEATIEFHDLKNFQELKIRGIKPQTFHGQHNPALRERGTFLECGRRACRPQDCMFGLWQEGKFERLRHM